MFPFEAANPTRAELKSLDGNGRKNEPLIATCAPILFKYWSVVCLTVSRVPLCGVNSKERNGALRSIFTTCIFTFRGKSGALPTRVTCATPRKGYVIVVTSAARVFAAEASHTAE